MNLEKFFLITCCILLSKFVSAENTQILKCNVKNQEWNAEFILDAVGKGFLRFIKANDATVYVCGLSVRSIDNNPKAVSSNITVKFLRNTCDPELAILENEIFTKLTLIIDTKEPNKPQGLVQWLRKKQPDNCTVEKLSQFDISMNSKKWLEGKWGRKTASDPKELKQLRQKKKPSK